MTMMDRETQLKLQAYLDGELSAGERPEVERRLAGDPEARAVRDELEAVRQVLAGNEPAAALGERREFYWSKIERQIRREPAGVEKARAVPFWTRFRRLVVPAGAMAGLVLAALIALMPSGSPTGWQGAELESTATDPGAFTYRDYASGTTLVWLSFPAESDWGELDAFDDPP